VSHKSIITGLFTWIDMYMYNGFIVYGLWLTL